jgi:hypothetical protein
MRVGQPIFFALRSVFFDTHDKLQQPVENSYRVLRAADRSFNSEETAWI